MSIDELKTEVTNAIEKKMTMRQQVDFANFCKSETLRALNSYVDTSHEKASKSETSAERESHYKEIDYVGEMIAELR